MGKHSNNLTLLIFVGLISIDVSKLGEFVADISCGPEILEVVYTCDPSLIFSFERNKVML